MIIGSKINGEVKFFTETSPLKEAYVSNQNLTLLDAFKILGAVENQEYKEVNSETQKDITTNDQSLGNPFGFQVPEESAQGENKVNNEGILPPEVKLTPEETVQMEEAPVNTKMGSIATPEIEEINKLRAVISDASNQIQSLTNQLDELQQLLQITLDNEKGSIKM